MGAAHRAASKIRAMARKLASAGLQASGITKQIERIGSRSKWLVYQILYFYVYAFLGIYTFLNKNILFWYSSKTTVSI